MRGIKNIKPENLERHINKSKHWNKYKEIQNNNDLLYN